MNREFENVRLVMHNIQEVKGISDFIKSTSILVKTPEMQLDQGTIFHMASLQEQCEGLVENNVEISKEKPYKIRFTQDRINSFKKYVGITLEHSKSAGCTDNSINMVNEAIKYLS